MISGKKVRLGNENSEKREIFKNLGRVKLA